MNKLNRLKKFFLLFTFYFLFSTFVSGCVTIYNPATEQRETLLINTKNEVSLGTNLDKQMQQELPISKDRKMQVRLNSIGARIAKVSDRQDLKYYFRIVKDKEFNAFALPGGFVYVNSALLEAATDDELACVIGHEVGHIAARHSVKRLQSALGYQLIIGIALGSTGKQATAKALDIVFDLVHLGYSRKDEFLADKLAVKYAIKANFNPYGMVTFFEKLKLQSDSKSAHYTPIFLSSHPPIDERINKVKTAIALYQGS